MQNVRQVTGLCFWHVGTQAAAGVELNKHHHLAQSGAPDMG
jgi:hypothetical protein